jgi:predicted  nucleic acid-binding Zn-ribbon protein
MENFEIHPTIDNTELLKNREDLEKEISNLQIEIGKNKAFIEDPSAEDKESVQAELKDQQEKLISLMSKLEEINSQYNVELQAKVEEIEQSFSEEKAA